jgi:hypothetical protein
MTHVYTHDTPVAVASSCRSSAVAWPAIIAGAVIATATSLALLILGSSFGLAVASPWSEGGVSTATVTAGIVIWMIVMQWSSAALGGYIAGRMRARWTHTDPDEVFFRDTAHGFLTWAVATLLTACMLTSATAGIVGVGAKAAQTTSLMQAASPTAESPFDYALTGLSRSNQHNLMADHALRKDALTIALHSLTSEKGLSTEDRTYLTQRIANHANISLAESGNRVNQFANQIESVKKQADEARKASASMALFTFLSLLIGAFIASVAAAMGGRERDII